MAESQETFYRVISGSEALAQFFESVVAQVSDMAQATYGVSVDRDMAVQLSEVRVATLSQGQPDPEAILRELQNLPQVKETLRRRELDAALAQGQEEALEEYKGLSPAQKMTLARTRGHTMAAPVKVKPGPEAEAQMLKKIMSLSNRKARIDLARKMGLA